jgi:hypothetical protein
MNAVDATIAARVVRESASVAAPQTGHARATDGAAKAIAVARIIDRRRIQK